ncbi:hypothetical protein D3C71_1244200 [compost metagenome]
MIVEHLRNDHQVHLVIEKLVSKHDARIHTGFDDHPRKVGFDGANKARQPGHRRQLGHSDSHVPLQNLRTLQQFDGRVPLIQQPLGLHEHLFALLRQPCGSHRPIEQRGIEKGLQFLNAFRHCRLGGVKPGRRLRESPRLHHPEERFELLERHHSRISSSQYIVARNICRFQFIAFFDRPRDQEFF